DDLSATPGVDFTVASGTLVFAPGETSKTIAVTAFADEFGEPTEVFDVYLLSPTNAAIEDGLGICHILDTTQNEAPRITNFVVAQEGQFWTITGKVEDEDRANVTIEFGGILEGHTTGTEI